MNILYSAYLSASLAVLTIPLTVWCQDSQGAVPNAATAVQGLVRMHEAWSEKLTTPGASIRAREIERRGAAVQYNLYVSGLPNDRVYNVVSWPITQSGPSTIMSGVSIGKDGVVACTGRLDGECSDPSGDKDNAVDFTFDRLSGEPNRLAIVAGDQRAAVILIPDPISASDHGCTLNVERLMPHFEIAYFIGSGYQPDARVLFQAESNGERHMIETTADHEGSVRFVMLPLVSGHHRGTAQIKPVENRCAPFLKFEWGQ